MKEKVLNELKEFIFNRWSAAIILKNKVFIYLVYELLVQ
jgi:hypothetical protein